MGERVKAVAIVEDINEPHEGITWLAVAGIMLPRPYLIETRDGLHLPQVPVSTEDLERVKGSPISTDDIFDIEVDPSARSVADLDITISSHDNPRTTKL